MGELVYLAPASAAVRGDDPAQIERNRLVALSAIAKVVARLCEDSRHLPSAPIRDLVAQGREIVRRLALLEIDMGAPLDALQQQSEEMRHVKQMSADWQRSVVRHYRLAR